MTEQGPPPIQAPVLTYATPQPYQHQYAQAAWRQGEQLIVPAIVSLPLRCTRCNAEVTDGWRWRKTLYWHHPALALMILFPGLLIYAIVALIVRKKAMVEASLCPEHRSARSRWILMTWLTAFGSVVALVGGFVVAGNSRNNDVAIVYGLIGFLVLLIAALVFGNKARVLSPAKIDSQYAWLKGAGPDFLSNFPSV